MNQVPEEITIEELPAYREATLKSSPKTRISQTFRPGSSRKGVKSPMLKTVTSDGTTLYVWVKAVFRKTSVWLTKSKAIDVFYDTSAYINSDNDVRRIASLIGLKTFATAVAKEEYILTDDLIESLFEQDKAIFFVSKNRKMLLASAFETDQNRLGPLQSITAADALRKYGVKVLDEAVERGIAAING